MISLVPFNVLIQFIFFQLEPLYCSNLIKLYWLEKIKELKRLMISHTIVRWQCYCIKTFWEIKSDKLWFHCWPATYYNIVSRYFIGRFWEKLYTISMFIWKIVHDIMERNKRTKDCPYLALEIRKKMFSTILLWHIFRFYLYFQS